MNKTTTDYYPHHPQSIHTSARDVAGIYSGPNHHVGLGNKENKLQSASHGINNLNRTSSALPSENRRNTTHAGSTKVANPADSITAHYQSHREFGKEISNHTAAGTRNGSHSTKVSNAPPAPGLGSSHNASLFKNFMSQYTGSAASANNQYSETQQQRAQSSHTTGGPGVKERSHHTSRVSSKNQQKASYINYQANQGAGEMIMRYSNKTSVSHYDIRNSQNGAPSQLKSYDSSRSRVN